jgi:hypothetical protein
MIRLFVISFLLTHVVYANAQRAVATLDRSTVAVGEGVGFSIACENFQPLRLPGLPAIPGLRISNSGSGRSFQLGGGQQISTLTYNFLITANKTGTYTIPGVSIQSNSDSFKTQPLKLRVVAADSPDNKNQISDYAFIRLIPSKNKAYVGEPIPIEIQLFLQNGRFNMPELTAEGFNLTEYPEPKSSRAQKGNAIYQVRTFQTAATPVKAGKLNIGPVKMDVVLKIRQNQRRRSPFNDPFEGLLTRYQDVPVKIEAKAQNITVKPLPTEGRPDNFNGAVGQFSMTAKASPLEVTVGDPVTINIELSGLGTIESLSLPKLELLGFKSYEPSISSKRTDPLGLTGIKAFEQVIIPENETIKEVPKIEITYFDPKTESYKILSQGPFPLKVNPSTKPNSIPSTFMAETDSSDFADEKPKLSEILWIKYEEGTLSHATPFVIRPAFWLLQSIPLLFFIGALNWRRKKNAFANNPKLRRQLQVEQITSKTLAKLLKLAEENKALEFYIELATVLREHLGLKLDIPSEGITCDSIDEPLAQKSINAETRVILRRLFTSCDAASYAASQSTAELRECLNNLKKVISDLK